MYGPPRRAIFRRSSACSRTIPWALGASASTILCPRPIYDAFDAITKQAGNQVLVAVESEDVVGCLQLTFISKTLPPMVPIRFQIMLTSDVMNGAATLQDVLGRYELNCSCEDCAHCVRLVTEELIEKFGPEYEIPNLKMHFKCARCGSPSGVVVHLTIIDRPI